MTTKLKHDDYIKNIKYLLYYDGLSKNLVDRYNVHIARKDKVYFGESRNPINYIVNDPDPKRIVKNYYIDDQKKKELYIKQRNEYLDLHKKLNTELANLLILYQESDYKKYLFFKDLKAKINYQLISEIYRLGRIIRLKTYYPKEKKIWNINHLFLIFLFILIIIFTVLVKKIY